MHARRRPIRGHQPAVYLPSADRRRLGSAGQHLRLRRLRRLARREVRQERPLHQVGRHARQRAAAVQHAARDRGGRRRAWSTWPTAATRASGARQRPEPEGDVRQRRRAVGDLHLGGAASVPVQLQFVPDRQQLRPGARRPARSTRWSWTARCSAGSARPGTALKEFSSVHQMDCRNPNELYVAEITAWRVQKIILRPQAADVRSAGNRRPP